LTQLSEGDSITSFAYDGDGGRVRKSTVNSQQSTETTYIGSLFEIDSSGKITKHIFAGANRVCSIEGVVPVAAKAIISGSNRVVLDTQRLVPPAQMSVSASAQASTFPRQEVRKVSPEPKISYYHPDHLGSSNVISDKDGALVQKIEYAPYGAIASTEPSTPNPVTKYLFTGKELDSSTGLYYYGARYYDPQVGRFITPDTIVQAPYDPQSLNRYSYCRNNPINYVDPSGNSWLGDIFKEISRWFSQAERGLEKATGTEWDINVNAQTTVNFGAGGSQNTTTSTRYSSSSSNASVMALLSQLPVEQLISVIGWQNLVSWFDEPADTQKINNLYSQAQNALKSGNFDTYTRISQKLQELGIAPPGAVLQGKSPIVLGVQHSYLVAAKDGQIKAMGFDAIPEMKPAAISMRIAVPGTVRTESAATKILPLSRPKLSDFKVEKILKISTFPISSFC